MKDVMFCMVICAIMISLTIYGNSAQARSLSVYDIQYTEDPNGASPWESQIVDCNGGIITSKWLGWNDKIFVQDPNYPAGWGAIAVKDRTSNGGLFNNLSVGDYVALKSMYVEEFRGTTFLQCLDEYRPNITVISSANPVPQPLLLSPDEIAAPEETTPGWYVTDHSAEKYEAMLLKVFDVVVKDKGLGKASDNYVLADRNDPNLTCWASDYMNEDVNDVSGYHPYVEIDSRFCGVTGVLEQYTKTSSGWDYYQLLTRATEDFLITQPADLDDDCDVDFTDFAAFAGHWLETGCTEPDWCGGADLAGDGAVGVVDFADLAILAENWLKGKY